MSNIFQLVRSKVRLKSNIAANEKIVSTKPEQRGTCLKLFGLK